jgi:peptide/nickel transport system ATP-binding protein
VTLLNISGLRVCFRNQSGLIHAVDSVDLVLESGESCALVGESGCGKTVLGMAVMRLLPSNALVEGSIRYQGTNLTELENGGMQQIRGREIAMIPQNSALALNPVMTIGRQIVEPLLLHQRISFEEATKTALHLLDRMGIANPVRVLGCYPHELSGGMRERVLIAMVLASNPSLVIADEPTGGLDFLVRKQTLAVLREQFHDRALLLITHDLGSAHVLCSRIAVMYAGEIVESGSTHDVLAMPMHPYTQGLLATLPSAGLHPIPGMSPSPLHLPGGCRFFPRCPSAMDRCRNEHPSLSSAGTTRRVRCLRYD